MRYQVELHAEASESTARPWVQVEGAELGQSNSDGTGDYRLGVKIGGRSLRVDILDPGPPALVSVQGRVFEVRLQRTADGTTASTGRHHMTLRHEQQIALTTATKVPTRGERALKSPMPGRILRLQCKEGATVAEGDPLLVIEAMKMENELFAPTSGVVSKLSVVVGQSVESGATLLVVRP